MFFELFGFNNRNMKWRLRPIIYEETDPLNYSGKVRLPEIILEDLTFCNFDIPYIFELSNEIFKTHVTPHDFTAPFGYIQMPMWIYEQLCLNDEDVTLQYIKIIKGDSLKILPHSISFLEIDNTKEILESCLNNYPVLTTGDEIMLNIDDFGPMRFTINEVNGGEGVIYTPDRDIKVEFLEPIGYKEHIEKYNNCDFIEEVYDEESGLTILDVKKLGVYFF